LQFCDFTPYVKDIVTSAYASLTDAAVSSNSRSDKFEFAARGYRLDPSTLV
jgi:hypothetical protein